MRKKFLGTALAAVSLIGLSGCVTDPNTGERKVSRTVLGTTGGAAAGYLLGGIIGGKTARIIGAGLGGAAGGYVGYNKDQQIKELREQTAGTGVEVTDAGDSIMLNLPDGVTFAVDSSNIQPQFRNTLNSVAQSLINYPNSLIDVYGYTDSTGAESYNQQLSERRAQAVSDYLVSQGVPRGRIASKGFGESNFVASNDTENGRSLNRRVEMKIIPITQDDLERARNG
ncbi:OmpA family protein [Croceicoccus sp. F390]|uniref:OmpA family protein n=1 Tax=Croceicoccus esteveae TaxID=3075597 RepID=A0ABU2ZGT3_9SPHN|nr:OmpA family protein [Croceicoccus sp. F390]MDT0575801.1 OmpA family protein [Croceicoccus sp. F390]